MSRFGSDLKSGTDKPIQSLGARIKSALNPAALIGGGIALAGAAVVAGLVGAAKALIDIERLNAQTDAAIRSTGGVANVSRQHIEDLGESMESLTTIERETVQEADNMLLTFTKVRNEVGKGNDIFDQATASALDVSVALGTDATSAAMLLGKALNDPIRGMLSMTRAGIQFTDQQKEMIKAMVESGDMLGAQKIILAELETQFGGSAEAFANTTAGRVQRFQNDVGNMFESIIVGATKVADFFGQDPVKIAAEMEAEAKAARLAVSGETQQMMYDLTRIVADRKPIETEWRATVGFLPQEVRDRFQEIRTAGFQQQVEYAKGLLDGQNNVKVAIEAAMQIIEDEMTKTEEIAYLEGQRGSLNYARGIASAEGKTASVAAIDGALALVRQRLGVLGVDFYTYGVNLGNSFAAGIDSRYGVVRTASGRLAQAAAGQIGIRSEPQDADSPLRGITKWGGNIVKTIADGMVGELGTATSAAGAVAGMFVPPLGTTAMGMAGGGMAGGTTKVYQLYTDGERVEFDSKRAMVDYLEQIGETWG